MKKTLVAVALMMAVVFVSGCTMTNLVSYTDPAYKETVFQNVLIVVPDSSFERREKLEEIITKNLIKKGIQATKSIDLFPPTRTFSEEELSQILIQNGIESFLVVAQSDYWITHKYIPRSSSTSGNAYSSGNNIHFQSTTQESGGYTISKPNAKYELRLFDTSTQNLAWIGNATVNGSAISGYNDLASGLANKLANQLLKDGIIVAKVVP